LTDNETDSIMKMYFRKETASE